MYCSGCGQPLELGQPFCNQCGRPATPPVPSIPGFQFQLENYASKIRALSVVWFIYAGLTLLTGLAGMTFLHAFISNHHFGPWSGGPWNNGPGPDWFGPAILHVAWAFLLVRSALAFAAGWALMERSRWGRVLAIVAAFFSIIKFPFGTALGIWTLVVLLGYRNTTLYEQL
jgi:hypothetical protein